MLEGLCSRNRIKNNDKVKWIAQTYDLKMCHCSVQSKYCMKGAMELDSF